MSHDALRSLRRALCVACALVLAWAPLALLSHAQTLPYQDASLPTSERVEDLLGRMTLLEKVGQMAQMNFQMINTPSEEEGWGTFEVVPVESRIRDLLRECPVGSFLNGAYVPSAQWAEFTGAVQRLTMEESRLGIPTVYGIDHVHGMTYLEGGTLFPQALGVAATFDTAHAAAMGRVTAREAAPLGHRWNFAPIQDLGVDPRWPRLYETYGEDPLLAGLMGAAYVRALQGDVGVGPHRMAATPKHFLGYSASRSGWDRTPATISEQDLYALNVPPFRAAIEAGAKTVMINSGEINGVPVHASRRMLTGLLREELGFEGVAVTDWGDVIKLVEMHRVAEDEREATRMAIEAGIDISMVPSSLDYCGHVVDLVESGELTEARIDESVRRVLRLKFELGLFETPMPSLEYASLVGSEPHQAAALDAARASLVLLKNDTLAARPVLPLDAESLRSVLVVGPGANSHRNLSGGWTIEWRGSREERYPQELPTVYRALRDALAEASPSATVTLGDTTLGERGTPDYDAFVAQAREADAVVLVLGERPYAEFTGNSVDLTLPSDQRALFRAAQESGTPVVLVMMGGRPLVIEAEAEAADALIWAGLPGPHGGRALAEVILGQFAPEGRLPFSYPRGPSTFLAYHHKPSDLYHATVNADLYADNRHPTLYPFGAGHGYTRFAYRDLTLSSDAVGADGSLEASVTLQNVGERAGTEAALWYVTDDVGSTTRPVRLLRRFEKVALRPGEARTITFRIRPREHLAYPSADGRASLEPGTFRLRVGTEEATFRLRP
jgi:beta-glucosidase